MKKHCLINYVKIRANHFLLQIVYILHIFIFLETCYIVDTHLATILRLWVKLIYYVTWMLFQYRNISGFFTLLHKMRSRMLLWFMLFYHTVRSINHWVIDHVMNHYFVFCIKCHFVLYYLTTWLINRTRDIYLNHYFKNRFVSTSFKQMLHVPSKMVYTSKISRYCQWFEIHRYAF